MLVCMCLYVMSVCAFVNMVVMVVVVTGAGAVAHEI